MSINNQMKMKKITLLIICIKIITFNAIAQQPTRLGIHGTSDFGAISNIGAKVARYGFPDYKIKNAIIYGDSTALNKMMQLNFAGVEQVIFLTHPEDTIGGLGPSYQRIPTGIDSIEVFQYLDTFLMEAGPYIDWIQISQEPQGKTPYNDSIYTVNQVLNWWRTLATFIKSKIYNNPVQLGHLKIVTGGISALDALDTLTTPTTESIDSIIKFGEDYCDAIDVHLHTYSLNKGIQQIAYIKNRTSHPLVSTEWSQAKAATKTGWINSINTVWTNPSHPFFNKTNFEVIDSAYTNPISLAAWDSLIATLPYSVNFITDFYAVMDSNCFLFACYGGAFQFGNPKFDWKDLFTNKVTPNTAPNQPFYNEYVYLASLINNGGYFSNCDNVNSVDDNFQKNQDYMLEIYPNPTNGSFSLLLPQIKNNTELYIINALGQKVYSKYYHANSAGKIINISLNLPSGIYFVALKNYRNLSVRKFVIMK